MDPRTLVVLHNLAQNERIDKLYGCISTGKEANVYLAESYMHDFIEKEMGDLTYYAVKVFKTSILEFRDRARYIEGDPSAFDEIYARTSRRVIRYFEAVGHDREMAEELCIATYLKLHRARVGTGRL